MQHADGQYEQELRSIYDQILLMSARVEDMLSRAMRAFEERDARMAEEAMSADSQVDQLELDIDEACVNLLSTQKPALSDLRFVTTALKVVTDLERIGDLGVNICERVIELGDTSTREERASIIRMAEIAMDMLRDALDAFVARDPTKAEQVILRDRQVDAYYARLFSDLVRQMMADSSVVERATRLQSIGRYLERVADHATNVGEMVVFMVRGRDVRHPRVSARGESSGRFRTS